MSVDLTLLPIKAHAHRTVVGIALVYHGSVTQRRGPVAPQSDMTTT
jgi:hypothetical protein